MRTKLQNDISAELEHIYANEESFIELIINKTSSLLCVNIDRVLFSSDFMIVEYSTINIDGFTFTLSMDDYNEWRYNNA